MPYSKTQDLPENVRENLPAHAQDIYKEAFNSAWKEYDKPGSRRDDATREETAHKIAWSAVKKKYKKENEKWIQK